MKYDMPGEPYWAIDTGNEDGGINGGFTKRGAARAPMMTGMNGYCVTMIVESYDEMKKKILEHGGIEAMAKFALPGMAWQGYYIDTEGNTFGIHQADTNAK